MDREKKMKRSFCDWLYRYLREKGTYFIFSNFPWIPMVHNVLKLKGELQLITTAIVFIVSIFNRNPLEDYRFTMGQNYDIFQ